MRAFGIDMSVANQPQYSPKPHHDFVMIKFSEGTWTDQTRAIYPLRRNAVDFVEDILPVKLRGAYHYLRSKYSWQQQRDAFLAVHKEATDRYKQQVIHYVAADFEARNNTFSAAFASTTGNWIAAVEDALGLPVILYTNRPNYQAGLMPFGTWHKNIDLHIAQYPYRGWNDRMLEVPTGTNWQPVLPAGRTQWDFWQYSADSNRKGKENGVTVIGNLWPSLDLNVFNGTKAQLYAKYGVSDTGPKPPEEKTPTVEEMLDAAVDNIIFAKELL